MKLLLILLVMALIVVGCNPGSPTLKSEDDKTIYTVGSMFGGRLGDLNFSDKELDILVAGLRDAAMNKKPAVEMSKYQMKVQQLFRSRVAKSVEVRKKEGGDHLAEFIKSGAIKTKSGLTYKIITPGKGKKPKATDEVEVHYHGTLMNGTVFDSSKERGKTATFPLNRVIKGWTEGLQLIAPGGKIELIIPPELAYGDRGAPPKIPGGSTLKFEVELFKILDKKAGSAKKPGKRKMKRKKK